MSFEVVGKYAKWVGLTVLMVLAFIVWVWFRPKQKTVKPGEPILPEAPAPLLEAVQQAHEDALKARVKASATSEAHTAQVEEISKIDDGQERRKRLAAMLKKQ